MSELPPADWYPDPEDPDQYRYWDGTAWSEHRAPRYAEDADAGGPGAGGLSAGGPVPVQQAADHPVGSGLRSPGALISESFSLLKRCWILCILSLVASAASSVVFIVGFYWTADRVLMGRFNEVLDTVLNPDFDPESPVTEAFFRSLEWNWSAGSLLPLALALIVGVSILLIYTIAVTRFVDSDLRGRRVTIAEALSQSMGRLLRMIGLAVQIVVFAVVAMFITFAVGASFPPALIILIPALLAAPIVFWPVISIASVVVSVGPSEWSLQYSARLIKGRFWAVLGRLLLILVIAVAIGILASMPLTALTTASEELWWLSTLVSTIISNISGLLITFVTVMVYHDLGGISQDEH